MNTESEALIHLCTKHSKSIMSYLRHAGFEYFLSGIQAWVESRTSNNTTLRAALANSDVPKFIEVSHSCINCLTAMKPCTHQCCRDYYFKVGSKCQFIDGGKISLANPINAAATPSGTVTPINVNVLHWSKRVYNKQSRKKFARNKSRVHTKKKRFQRKSSSQKKAKISMTK